MTENANVMPKLRDIFIKTMRGNNIRLSYCGACNSHPKVTVLNFSTIEITCCNHLGQMVLQRRAERFESFCLRAMTAWNKGEYEHGAAYSARVGGNW